MLFALRFGRRVGWFGFVAAPRVLPVLTAARSSAIPNGKSFPPIDQFAAQPPLDLSKISKGLPDQHIDVGVVVTNSLAQFANPCKLFAFLILFDRGVSGLVCGGVTVWIELVCDLMGALPLCLAYDDLSFLSQIDRGMSCAQQPEWLSHVRDQTAQIGCSDFQAENVGH